MDNQSEHMIQTVKSGTKNTVVRSDIPLIFWWYWLERLYTVENLGSKGNDILYGHTPPLNDDSVSFWYFYIMKLWLVWVGWL